MTAESQKCSRCGLCAGVCPVFAEVQRETYSARGKTEVARALLQGVLPFSEYTEDIFSKCLLCLACKGACAAGVDQSRLILGTRAELARRRGLPLSKKIAFRYLLKNRSIFRRALKAFALLQGLGGAAEGGELRHLPFFLSAFGEGRLIPKISPRPLRDEYPEVIPPAKGPAKMRIGFFTGCFIDFVDPAIGRALIQVLGQNGVEVVFPKKQTCCGIPVFMSGDIGNGLALMKRNLEAFAPHRLDGVVTACATCGTALKESYGVLVQEESREWQDRVAALSGMAKDASEFLADQVQIAATGQERKLQVTYHDPCHLVRGQNISAQPRQILKSLPGVVFTEMREAARCCGGGGSFSFYHYDLSKQISRRKVENIEATGASVVVTGCPGCMLHLKDQLAQKGSRVAVKHLVQLVAGAGGEEQTLPQSPQRTRR